MNKVFIIAEAGVNHNGSIELAKKLIDVAVKAKVDAVKFQTFKAENLVSKNALITVGQIESNKIRVKIYNKLKQIGFNLPVIISPLAYVSKHSFIDEGTVVMHYALVNANTKIGKNCIINTKALIEHDCIVEDNCHISTASIINGGVIVKENSFVGSNATSKQSIEISGFIKAGSLAK